MTFSFNLALGPFRLKKGQDCVTNATSRLLDNIQDEIDDWGDFLNRAAERPNEQVFYYAGIVVVFIT